MGDEIYTIFLFYREVEEKIEKVTSVELEIFTAMKTRATTNSVTKYAKRSTCKVESILERIMTREKDNNEATK